MQVAVIHQTQDSLDKSISAVNKLQAEQFGAVLADQIGQVRGDQSVTIQSHQGGTAQATQHEAGLSDKYVAVQAVTSEKCASYADVPTI